MIPRPRRRTIALVLWLTGFGLIWYLTPADPRVVVPRSEAGEVLGFTADGRGAYGFMYGSFDPTKDSFCRDEKGPIPDGPFRVWDVQTGQPVVTWKPPESEYVRHWLPSYPAALVVSADRERIYLLDLRTGAREFLPDDIGPLADDPPCLTPDGRYLGLLTLDTDTYILKWYDRHRKKVVASFSLESPCPFHTDGRWATVHRHAGPQGENIVLIREAVTGRILTRHETKENIHIHFGEFSPDGQSLLVSIEGAFSIISESGQRSDLPMPPDTIHAYLVDDRHLMTDHMGPDGTCWLNRWDVATGKHLGRYELPAGFEPVRHFDPVRRHILIRSTDALSFIARLPVWVWGLPGADLLLKWDTRTYRVLDSVTEQLIGEYQLAGPSEVRLSPDGRTLTNVNRDGALEFWDIPPRKSLRWFALAAFVWALPVVWLARRAPVARET